MYAHSAITLYCWLIDERERGSVLSYLSFSFYVFIFSIRSWPILGSNVSQKGHHRAPGLVGCVARTPLLISAFKANVLVWMESDLSAPIYSVVDVTCISCTHFEAPWILMHHGIPSPLEFCAHGVLQILCKGAAGMADTHTTCTYLICLHAHSIVPSEFIYKTQVQRQNYCRSPYTREKH